MRGRFHVARLVPGDELHDHVNRHIVPLAGGGDIRHRQKRMRRCLEAGTGGGQL
jgi:hypothetical protein